MPTQAQMFYAAERRSGDRDATFMELINHSTNPMTREDLARNIERRPELWSRYVGFLDKLPPRTTTTGQAIYMDHVIQEIARELDQ